MVGTGYVLRNKLKIHIINTCGYLIIHAHLIIYRKVQQSPNADPGLLPFILLYYLFLFIGLLKISYHYWLFAFTQQMSFPVITY